MSETAHSDYVYVTYIRATPEKVWEALTSPDFQRQYWFGMHQDCEWRPGAPWKMLFSDGRVADAGQVLEIEPPVRLVLEWRNEFRPELTAEGASRCTYLLEPQDGAVKLTVRHEIAARPSKFIEAVSGGWPQVLSNLKSLLETGAPAFELKA